MEPLIIEGLGFCKLSTETHFGKIDDVLLITEKTEEYCYVKKTIDSSPYIVSLDCIDILQDDTIYDIYW